MIKAIPAILAAIVLPSAIFAQEGRSYALQAIATAAAAPKMCPGTTPNIDVLVSATTAADINTRDAKTRSEIDILAGKLLEKYSSLGEKQFCALLLTAWGKEGAIIPNLLKTP